MEGGTKWEAEEKREEERGLAGTYVPSFPTLRAPFNVFFPTQIFFALPHYLTSWKRLLNMSLKAPGD